MIIVNKNSETKYNNKFLFSKIIKLKIPKPKKLKQIQSTSSQINQFEKRQLFIMANDNIAQNSQCNVLNKLNDREPRYSRLQKPKRCTIERSYTKKEIVMSPLAINKLKQNHKTKTIQYDKKEEMESFQEETQRSQSLHHNFNSNYSSARFFSKFIKRHNSIFKKDFNSSIYPPAAVEIVDENSIKMLPFIKRVLTFERNSESKKFKSVNHSVKKLKKLYGLHQPESKIEIRAWQRQKSYLDEQEDQMQQNCLNRWITQII